LTGTDGAIALPMPSRPEPLDGPVPDVFVSFDGEYFVEWQVAESASPSVREKQILLR
jgi:hypothetical protein